MTRDFYDETVPNLRKLQESELYRDEQQKAEHDALTKLLTRVIDEVSVIRGRQEALELRHASEDGERKMMAKIWSIAKWIIGIGAAFVAGHATHK